MSMWEVYSGSIEKRLSHLPYTRRSWVRPPEEPRIRNGASVWQSVWVAKSQTLPVCDEYRTRTFYFILRNSENCKTLIHDLDVRL